jgi:hypothetical protein
MTSLRASLTHSIEFDLETNEAKLQRPRSEAREHLDAMTNQDGNLVAVCRLIFEILALQRLIDQERRKISSASL